MFHSGDAFLITEYPTSNLGLVMVKPLKCACVEQPVAKMLRNFTDTNEGQDQEGNTGEDWQNNSRNTAR